MTEGLSTAPRGAQHEQKVSTRKTPRQGEPELALRMRKAATILTRAACLVAGDVRLKSGATAGDLSLSGVIGAAKRELYPDPRKGRHDGEPDEATYCWARALTWQEPVNRTPEAGSLIRAAKRLRRMAESEEQPLPTAAEVRAAAKRIDGIVPDPHRFPHQISIEVRGDGFQVWTVLYFGRESKLITAGSLEDLVEAARAAAAENDPAAKLRAEAKRLGYELVEGRAA